MKKFIITIIAISAFAFSAQAQSKNILTVDMQKLYNDYYKAQEANEKFKSSVENAQEEVKSMIDSGVALAEELKGLRSKLTNPGTAESAKSGIQADIQSKEELIRKKEAEVNQYRQQTDRTLQARRQSIVNLHVSEIREVVIEVAKSKGADLVLNSNGYAAVVYADDSYDITTDVLAKLNADAGN